MFEEIITVSFHSSSYQLEVKHISIILTCCDTNPLLSLLQINRSRSIILTNGGVANSGNLLLPCEEYQSVQVTITSTIDHLYSSDLVTPKFNCLFHLCTTLIHLVSLSILELPRPYFPNTNTTGWW